jgi:probable phosphoglycerate mutase
LPALTSYADALGDGETGIVVSHGAALRVAVPAFLEWHDEVSESLGVLANCGWIVLEHSASTWTGGVVRWRLTAWNRVAGE